MKKISFFCTILFCLCLSSCGELAKSPELHDDEIKDAVRYHIALLQSMANQTNNSWSWNYDGVVDDDIVDRYSELEDKLTPKYENTYQNETNAYRCAIQDVAYSNNKYSTYAQDVLDCYDRISVALSDYQEIISGQRWIFHELSTGITFTYLVYETGGDTKYNWSVEADEDSAANYFAGLLSD